MFPVIASWEIRAWKPLVHKRKRKGEKKKVNSLSNEGQIKPLGLPLIKME